MLAADPEARPVVVTDVGEARTAEGPSGGATRPTDRPQRRRGQSDGSARRLVRRPQELMFFLSSARWDSVNENFRRNKEGEQLRGDVQQHGGIRRWHAFARRATSANLRALPEEVRALPMEELRWLLKSRAAASVPGSPHSKPR